jgi:hypothetical protein
VPLNSEFTTNGSAAYIAHTTTYGGTVNLAAQSLTGAHTIAWSISGSSHSGFVDPTITPAGAPTGATASFTFPADPGGGEGRSCIVRLTLTDQRGVTSTTSHVVGVANTRGYVPISTGEVSERSQTHGWVDPINSLLAGISTMPALSDPDDDGKEVISIAGIYTLREKDHVDARDHGAVGDGTTNDKVALLAAVVAGIAANKPVRGAGLTYGVNGHLQLPANAWLQDITIKQLTPGTQIRTVRSNDVDNIRLERVKVDRNGDGTLGALDNDSIGLHIDGGTGHHLEDVEVYGDDAGTGLAVWLASNFQIIRPHVHDINYVRGSDPGDDMIQGIWILGCSKFSLVSPRVHDMGGTFPGQESVTQYSRGLAIAFNSDFSIVDAHGWDLDQGCDISGSNGNERWSVTGGVMSDCFSAGWKGANSARDGTFNGCIAVRCGQAGFIFSGPAEDALEVLTGQVSVVNCAAYDTGNDYWLASQNVAGFRIVNSDFDPETCEGIHFYNCRAIDRRDTPLMEYGFHNAVTGKNAVSNCESIGHTVAAVGGTWRSVDLGPKEFGQNVLAFGATRTGTGETDDTAFIQAAIDHVGDAGGGTVWIPRGEYRITALTVSDPDVVLLGEPGTILETTDLDSHAIQLQGARSGCRQIHVRTTGTPTAGAHFRMMGADTFLDRCIIENAYLGVEASNIARPRVENCRIISCASHGFLIGASGEPCTAPIIAGNIVQDITSGNAIFVFDSTDALIQGNQIQNLTNGDAILIASAPRARILGNLIAGASDDGIALSTAADCIVVGNTITGCPGDAIEVQSTVTGAVIKNNRYTSNGTNGPVIGTLTIASGAITLVGDVDAVVTVDTESAAATDDLDTISGGHFGQIISIKAANGARDVVVKDGTNIKLSADFTLDNTDDLITLRYDGSVWRQIGSANAGA